LFKENAMARSYDDEVFEAFFDGTGLKPTDPQVQYLRIGLTNIYVKKFRSWLAAAKPQEKTDFLAQANFLGGWYSDRKNPGNNPAQKLKWARCQYNDCTGSTTKKHGIPKSVGQCMLCVQPPSPTKKKGKVGARKQAASRGKQ
jgi:hypothetical protein